MANSTSTGTVALAVGGALGVIAVAFGIYSAQSLTPPQIDYKLPSKSTVPSIVEQAAHVEKLLQKERSLGVIAQEGDKYHYRDHYIFFAPELWEAFSDEKQKTLLVDIYAKDAPEIHPQIPNTWFVENGLKDILGRADAPSCDSDGDGFTNAEEFVHGTNPSDPQNYPSLVADGACKVRVTGVRHTNIQIAAPSMMALEKTPASVRFSLYKGFSETPAVKTKEIEVGGKFGMSSAPERFVLQGFDQHPFAPAGASEPTMETVAKICDTGAIGSPVYYVRAGRSKAGDKLLGTDQEKGKRITDTRANFIVTAGTAAQEGKAAFSVMLKDSFVIPGNGKTRFRLDSVNDDGSVVLLEEGKELPITVPPAESKISAGETQQSAKNIIKK